MKEQVLQLKFALNGAPWCRVTSGNINANGMQFKLNGAPWWGHSGIVQTGHIKSINGIAWEHIKSYCGIDQAHIKSAMGVEG